MLSWYCCIVSLIAAKALEGWTKKELMAMAGKLSVLSITAAAMTVANVTANIVTTAAPG
jgi:hypothetical protein